MASTQEFVDFVLDQIDPDCAVTARRMFGEFGLYSAGTFFGVICDDRLFVKPTDPGRAYIGDVVEAPPYPGAKDWLLVDEGVEDPDWLSELVRITARELAS
ncbi:MAG: TfoX/Sxy family protein [Gemmatimonadota bacterium]|nr:TfoX/Sxy family protein [Gemmatimonadota bacterium]